jgi:hypothetical protein
METTIITLAPTSSNQPMTVRTTASFEEAFGEFSEARGKGRARRKARKLSKISDKQEVKQARKGGRQEARIARRTTRKTSRQALRDSQQASRSQRRGNIRAERQEAREAKQARKDTNARGEQERENYAQEQEQYRESLQPQDNGGSESPESEGNEMTDNGGYAPQSSSYPEDGASGTYSEDEDWNTPPQGYDDEGYSEDDSEGGYSEEDYGNEEEGDYNNADGDATVSPRLVQHMADIDEEKRQVSDLMKRRAMMQKIGSPITGIDMQIERRMKKVQAMYAKIADYSNADGDAKKAKARRSEIRRAQNKARGRGKGYKAGKPRNPNAMQQMRNRKRNLNCVDGGSETPVEAELNPQFSPNRIVVPAKMKSSFEGETGYDDIMDSLDDFDYDTMTENGRPVVFDNNAVVSQPSYMGDDYPTPRVYELKSNASGENKVVWKSIAIGVGIGVLALYLAKRYKIIK